MSSEFRKKHHVLVCKSNAHRSELPFCDASFHRTAFDRADSRARAFSRAAARRAHHDVIELAAHPLAGYIVGGRALDDNNAKPRPEPTMPTLYPLRFEPLLRRYLWGGRRLESRLGKTLPPGDDYAESWEVVDHGDDQSVVRAGPLAGTTLHALVQEAGSALLGRHDPLPQFPLLFKFLDAHRNLSVQVHPNDQQAALQIPPDLGKTEAWVVLHAEPGSTIFAGLKRGFDRNALAREVDRGTTELCLHALQPRVGDCLFIPAGTVHALGAGLVVAEIQQASDTTFRIFDWNRVDADGRPRQLHLDQALDVINFEHGPVSLQQPVPTDRTCVERLVECDKFILDRWDFTRSEIVGSLAKTPPGIGGDDRCHLIAVLAGTLKIADDPLDAPLEAGETCLLPAACGEQSVQVTDQTVLLDIFLP